MSLINYLIKLVEWNSALDKRLAKIEEWQKVQIRLEEQDRKVLREILEAVTEPKVSSIFITQGDSSMAVTGIVLGATGTFKATLKDAQGNVISPAPLGFVLGNWASSDPTNTTPGVSADGLLIEITVSATDPNPNFTLSLSGTNADGSPAEGSVVVPVLPVPPPPPPPPVNVASIEIDQVS